MEIKINTQSCTQCSRCVRVCPSLVLTAEKSGAPVVVNDTANCIVCGHCVAACQTSAVVHSEFPEKRVHAVDYDLYPTPEQMMMLVKARRSNRAFSKKPIPSVNIDMILEAAHRAPTASNSQNVSFTVIKDPETLRKVSEFVIDTFTSLAKKLTNPFVKPIVKIMVPDAFKYLPAFQRMKKEYEQGNDMILRGATALVLIHAPKASRFVAEDCNLAYQNGSLMAETLGISQFYTGFVLTAAHQKKGKLEAMLGIDGKIAAGLALGIPAFKYENYINRKNNNVNEVSI